MKVIHVYYINRIKDCLLRIFEAKDGYEENSNYIIARNNRAIDQWFNKAGVVDRELQREVLQNVDWCWSGCAKKLESLGWTILRGKENL